MAHRPRQPDHSPTRLLHRLDRAAERMNPFLVVLAIGLVAINLTCLIVLSLHMALTYLPPAFQARPPLAGSPSAGSTHGSAR